MEIELVNIKFQANGVIIAPTLVYFADGQRKQYLDLVIDTGGTSMLISKHALAQMGYTGFEKSTVKSLGASGTFYANICPLSKFNFCGLSFNNYPVKVWNAPQNHHVAGTIGMDILRHFNMSINTDTYLATIEVNNLTKERHDYGR